MPVAKGGYIVRDGDDAVLVATGSGASTLVPLLAREYVVDDVLALRGLGLLSERNR